MNISDIIRVPFGYLLDWLYQFTTNYGLALILFSLIVKIVLLPLNAKRKKRMLGGKNPSSRLFRPQILASDTAAMQKSPRTFFSPNQTVLSPSLFVFRD